MNLWNRLFACLAMLAFFASCLQPAMAAAHLADGLPTANSTADSAYDAGNGPLPEECAGMEPQASELCMWLCADSAEFIAPCLSVSSEFAATISEVASTPDLIGSLAARAPPQTALVSGRKTYLLTLRLRL